MIAKFRDSGEITEVPSDRWLPLIVKLGFKGVIFDCDGTLAESSVAHFRSMRAAVHQQGVRMEEEWYFERTGLDRRSLFKNLQTSRPVAV